jgi:hypothetical protein
MPDDAPIAPELFDYIDDYLDETALNEAVEQDELDSQSNLIVFCRELFAQLFVNVIGEAITTIGPGSSISTSCPTYFARSKIGRHKSSRPFWLRSGGFAAATRKS